MSRATQDTAMLHKCFVYGGVTLCADVFQHLPLHLSLATSRSYNPSMAGTTLVWALPRSLATTWGIIVIFSSSGY